MAKDGDKEKLARLESSLNALLLERTSSSKNDSIITFIDGLPPLIKILTPLIGAFLWFQTNFATTQMYREQEAKIIDTNTRLDNQYKEVKALIDQRHTESLNHSNENRDRMMSVMAEIKDSLKTLFLERQSKR